MNEDQIPTQQDISPALVAQRAEEIAVSDGRTAAETTDADFTRARAELSQPAPTEQVNPEPVDGFRRADVALATQGTQATSGYEDDAQIGAQLVEEGIEAAVHDEFVQSGRDTLAAASEEEPGREPEPATFTEPAVVPLKKKKSAPKPRAKAKAAPQKPAPKPAAKKISKPAAKKAPAKGKPKAAAKPKAKAKVKAKPAPKKAGKKAVKAKAKPKTKSKIQAKAKTKAPAKKALKAKPKAKKAAAKAKGKPKKRKR